MCIIYLNEHLFRNLYVLLILVLHIIQTTILQITVYELLFYKLYGLYILTTILYTISLRIDELNILKPHKYVQDNRINHEQFRCFWMIFDVVRSCPVYL